MEFRTHERMEAEEAATRLARALRRLGVELDDIEIDESCRTCTACSGYRIRINLGSLDTNEAHAYAHRFEALAHRDDHPRNDEPDT